MTKETCEGLLYLYLGLNEGWHKKVSLYAVAEDYSPETVGRALRNLVEEGKIFVDYYDGKIAKNLAMYSAQPIKRKKQIVNIIDGKAVITYEETT